MERADQARWSFWGWRAAATASRRAFGTVRRHRAGFLGGGRPRRDQRVLLSYCRRGFTVEILFFSSH